MRQASNLFVGIERAGIEKAGIERSGIKRSGIIKTWFARQKNGHLRLPISPAKSYKKETPNWRINLKNKIRLMAVLSEQWKALRRIQGLRLSTWGLRPGTSMTCRRRVCVIRRNLLKRAAINQYGCLRIILVRKRSQTL